MDGPLGEYFGFRHPATILPRHLNIRTVRVYIVYRVAQPEYTQFVSAFQSIGSSSFYSETLPHSEPDDFNKAYRLSHSSRFSMEHRNSSRNIVYYAYLVVNTSDPALRVYSKANLNNQSV